VAVVLTLLLQEMLVGQVVVVGVEMLQEELELQVKEIMVVLVQLLLLHQEVVVVLQQ
jgi:hypothetical protein